jgi:hypothetical protein
VLLEELAQKPESGFLYLRLFLILTILASCGMLSYYVFQQASDPTQTESPSSGGIAAYINDVVEGLFPEPGTDLQGKPHARNVSPRRFSLWELHASDSVRIVDIVTDPKKKGQRFWVTGPSLRPTDKILSEQIIGGRLLKRANSADDYQGVSYLRPGFYVRSTSDSVGCDMWVKKPPHLHLIEEDRLISIGVAPKDYQQEIIAVAIPIDSQIIFLKDYQPYRHIIMGDWDIFYYDVSNIEEHVSIHIAYRPGDKANPLDWPNVELRR